MPHARLTAVQPRTRWRTPLAAYPSRAPVVRTGLSSRSAAVPRTVFMRRILQDRGPQREPGTVPEVPVAGVAAR